MVLMKPTAIVTGASGGIGEAIVRRLIADGYRVGGVDFRASSDKYDGPDRINIQADVSSRVEMEDAFASIAEAIGPVSLVVCNAGYLRYQPFTELSQEDWDRTIAVDLTGVFIAAQLGARQMIDAELRGSIIIMGSISGELPSRTQGHYSSAKAGAGTLARSLAWELGASGIRVNSISPGWVDTALTADYLADPASRREVEDTIPLGRVGTPDDIADLVSFLASPRASYITGTSIRIDGGLIAGKDKK